MGAPATLASVFVLEYLGPRYDNVDINQWRVEYACLTKVKN